jgi:antitoxin PrlF
MPSIHETATVTSKGQITLPKSIRQALGIDVGGKVSFELQGETVIVTRAAVVAHEDPAIAGFLRLLEQDIRAGRQITDLPEPLLRKMVATLDQPVDPNAEIEGDVEL